ncbi:MAG: NAD(+) diphosphatase [Oscillospiraceae bacterium]|nr:NAD(+) diphosphatase [Oscillospiraceae bacterium]
MLQDIFPHIYHNEISWQEAKESDVVLSFQDGSLLAQVTDDRLTLPQVGVFAEKMPLQYLFSIDETAYYLAEEALPEWDGWRYMPTYPLRNCTPDEHLFAVAAGESLYRWYRNNRFCGKCGAQMEKSKTERAMVCPVCGNTVYPKICPAVIVAVHDGERLLLTRYKGRPFKRYALVAGFNEIGESIEQTVHREVMEEVGLKVKNLRFYKSQPWVFTDSLLMGFYAEVDGSDEITLQEDELAEANWHLRNEIPQDYSPISLTGEMIEQFRQGKM